MAIDTQSARAGADDPGEGSLPIAGYAELTVAQVLPRLDGLSVCELHQIADFERRHAHRRAVLGAIERLLG